MTTTPGQAQEHIAHSHEQSLKNPDGSWKYTNALADQASPYLLQHAHNPVDWYPWGTEAFELARKTGKPIFLSIGYATCYWCHVMERQVFENPELASQLNQRFVSIKVDREERPDVDDIYMLSVQMMTGHGGWPMSVFLTPPGAQGEDDPGLKPFWAGTYIPPEPRHGLPGFGQVVRGLADAWNDQRKQVLAQADQITHAVQQHLGQPESGQPQPASKLIQDAANQIARSYDAAHGGFGDAPKFPQPNNLQFMLKVYQNNPNPQLGQALAYTLERMARGGMYDQVGGGFHRYSTDEKWLVPHFEKMLYDNAQLVEVYLTAHEMRLFANSDHEQSRDANLYSRVVRETCDYVLREMSQPADPAGDTEDEHARATPGVFWSAQDAEVDAREGLNYLWTLQQVRAAIADQDLADLAVVMYGLDGGTNFQDPHHRDDPPANVLYLPARLDELADERKWTLDQIDQARVQINQQLLTVRDQRKQPLTDDKTLVAWNGMMIAALARAGAMLDEPRYTRAAVDAADAILKHMRSDDGGLFRTMRLGQAKIPAFLEDYAFFIHGLIQLHRVTGDDRWLIQARELMTQVQDKFSAQADRGGGYYDTLADQRDLLIRTVSTYDGAIPSGNSQMVHNLLDLYELMQQDNDLDRAITDLHAFNGALAKFSSGMAHMQHALLRALEIAPDRFGTSSGADAADATMQTPTGAPSPRRQVLQVTVDPEVVDLSSSAEGDPGSTIRVTLQIGQEYHLNAHDPGVAGLIPTAIELRNAEGFALDVQYPAGEAKQYAFADQPLRVYEGEVTLTATLVRTDAPTSSSPTTESPEHLPKLILRYQVCTDRSCLEPQEYELPVTLRVTP